MEASELITRARSDAGLTQAELARRASTSQPMVARYETGVSSPTVSALRRLLRAAGHDLVLASRPVSEDYAIADLPGPAVSALRGHRAEIRAQAERLGARNIRVFGPAAAGHVPAAAGHVPAAATVEMLVDFPVAKRGLLALLTLACQVEALTGIPVDVLTPGMLTPDAAGKALAEAVPL
jgi:transcriptional regulator with XRE-family HTH domain